MCSIQILFVVSATSVSVISTSGCRAIGILMHMTLLSAFMWMLIEGHHLYQEFVHVFPISRHNLLLKYASVAYVIPIVYVAIIAAGWSDQYGSVNDKMCWLQDSILPTFYIPVALVAVTNMFVFVRIERAIQDVPKNGHNPAIKSWRHQMKRRFRSTATFFALLGVRAALMLAFVSCALLKFRSGYTCG